MANRNRRTDRADARFFGSIRRHSDVRRACKVAGYSRSQVYVYRKSDQAFKAAWEGALKIFTDHQEIEAGKRVQRDSTCPTDESPRLASFTDAYLADTMHLSLEESGAYLKLLMVTWRNNGEPLPDDDKRMARILGVTVKKWTTKLRPVLVGFFDLSEGVWRQKSSGLGDT